MHHTADDCKNQEEGQENDCCAPSGTCQSDKQAGSAAPQLRKMICIECKHELEEEVQVDEAFECSICGISLVVLSMTDDEVELDVMDEGK